MCILSCKCNKYSNLFPKNTIKFLPTGEHFQTLLFPEAALFFVGEHFGAFLFPEVDFSAVGEHFGAYLFPEVDFSAVGEHFGAFLLPVSISELFDFVGKQLINYFFVYPQYSLYLFITGIIVEMQFFCNINFLHFIQSFWGSVEFFITETINCI